MRPADHHDAKEHDINVTAYVYDGPADFDIYDRRTNNNYFGPLDLDDPANEPVILDVLRALAHRRPDLYIAVADESATAAAYAWTEANDTDGERPPGDGRPD